MIVLENFSKIDKNSSEEKTENENVLKDKLSASNDELFLLQSLENSKVSKEISEKIKTQKKILADEINEIAENLKNSDEISISEILNFLTSERERLKIFLP